MMLSYKNKKHLKEFAKALILVKYQVLINSKYVILCVASANKNDEIDYFLFEYLNTQYEYKNGELKIVY